MNHRPSIESSRKDNERGFTLIEVIVAISILTVGILAVASMQIKAMGGNYFSSGVTESTTLAQDKLEELITVPYGDAQLSAGTHNEASPPTGYTIAWEVINDNPVTNTKLITITVTPQGKGVPNSSQLVYIRPIL